MTNFRSKQQSSAISDADEIYNKNSSKNGVYNAKNSKNGKKTMLFATFYEGSKPKPSKAEKPPPFDASNKPKFEDSKQSSSEMSSSKGFSITENDLRQGITLDKVLGGGFKKVNIFNGAPKQSETADLFPTPARNNANDISIEDTGIRYDSFEILESDNEEEHGGESRNQASRKKQGSRKARKEVVQAESNQNHEQIRDKINKKYKYKMSTVKQKFRQSQRSPEPFTNDECSKDDPGSDSARQGRVNANSIDESLTTMPSSSRTKNSHHNHLPASKLSELDSRSLSPRADYDGVGNRYHGSLTSETQSSKSNLHEQFNGSRKSFYKSGNDGNNTFRTSMNGFKRSSYEQGWRDNNNDSGRNRSTQYSLGKTSNGDGFSHPMSLTIKKQGFAQAYGMEIEKDRPNKTQAMFEKKMRDTGTRFHDKLNFGHFDQKGPIESNRIADRIKQHEQDMLNKYANKKLSSYDDSK